MSEQEKYFNVLFLIYSRITIAFMIIPIIVAFIKRKDLNKNVKIFLLFCLFALIVALFPLAQYLP